MEAPGLAGGAARAGSSLSAMVAAIPLGLALGLSLGAVGGGGAVLAVPLLVYVLGEDVHVATTTSLAVVSAAALAAGAVQAGRARVCWPQVGLFAPAAVAGVGCARDERRGRDDVAQGRHGCCHGRGGLSGA